MPPLPALYVNRIQPKRAQPAERHEPLWKGPEVDGITFSMLSRWLVCRERFRVRALEGWRSVEGFNHRIEYGQMWHTCEEALAAGRDWDAALLGYCTGLATIYPLNVEQIDHWYNVCKKQFPVYVDFWAQHPDVVNRQPILQEQVFDVPYDLPSGRRVRLRGKWDSVDLIGAGIYLQENKTKSEINENEIRRQLTFDLQTMMYLVALTQDTGIDALEEIKQWDGKKLTVPISGVRYNVIRRPLSGGKGSIVRHKPSKSNPNGESKEDYYNRLAEYIVNEPETYFARWSFQVHDIDIKRFCKECLNPILETLCVWYDVVANRETGHLVAPNAFTVRDMMNWRHPFGVWNSIDETGSSDLDEYLATGSTVGLERVDTLFRELT